LSFDIFGTHIPTFNFEGRNKVGSTTGLVSTALFYLLLGSFAGFKISRFTSGANPLISESQEVDAYDVNEKIILDDVSMLGAFEVTDFYSGETKDDPSLVEWKAQIIESTGLPESEVRYPIGVHKCEDEDWDSFYPASRSA
jgi:hypothetical protein